MQQRLSTQLLLLLLLLLCGTVQGAPLTAERNSTDSVKHSACPANKSQEIGPCVKGYRTNIVFTFERDSDGRCERKSKKVTLTCSKKSKQCPPKTVKKVGKCDGRVQRWLTIYFEFSKLKGRCVKKFRARERPCGDKAGVAASHSTSSAAKNKKCPKRRVMEPEPCKNGKHRVLIEHYEFDEKLGRCVAHKDYVTRRCGAAASSGKKKSAEKHDCPEAKISQSACRPSGYRTVTTEYYVFVNGLGRCVRKVKQEDEKCAMLLKHSACPSDSVVETGPCFDGFRTNIVYQYDRDTEGRCVSHKKSVTLPCRHRTLGCPARTRKKLSKCKDGIERWLTTYYVYNKMKGRCVRKLSVKELSCKKSQCPSTRIVEPGRCINGKQRTLILHYERDADTGKCLVKKDFIHKACGGKPSKRKEEAVRHSCPDSVFHQKPCRASGYRAVVKFYYRYNSVKGRCVKNVKVDEEKCSRLAAVRSNCRADEIVEEGPCSGGYRQNIVYKYSRNEAGRCVRSERRVTKECVHLGADEEVEKLLPMD